MTSAQRAQMASAAINDLPDSAFAYIEPGGTKDSSGKTTPRSLRHFPIHDAAHVRNALARAPQSPFGDKAMPAIRAAAKRFGITVGRSADDAPDARYNDQHAPAGSSTGGQFAAGGDSGKGKPAPTKKAAAHHATTAHHGSAQHDASSTLAYDPKTNTGPGYGSASGDARVHALQRDLNRLGVTDAGHHRLKDDGKLGPKTTAAVKKAQRRLGLPPDGKVTPALLQKLSAAKSLPGRSASMLDVCVRSFDFAFESRSGGGDDGRTLEGYAATFNSPARIRDLQGDFDETILPGAFQRSLETRTPVLQYDHGKDPRIGGVPIGAIEQLREDDKGLYLRARLYDHPDVERVRQAIAGRSIKGMSFRFGVPDKGDTWTRRSGDVDLREIRDADVHELGPVVFPAYDTTSVTVRSMLAQLDPDEHRSLIRELADELRLAVDLTGLADEPPDPTGADRSTDFTGRPGTRSPGGGEPGMQPGNGEQPDPSISSALRTRDRVLRMNGILHG